MSVFENIGLRAAHLLPPEPAHRAAITALKCGLGPRRRADYPQLKTRLAGLNLPNPVGLAAGFDKDAQVAGPLLAAGFGFVECGSVTPRPQRGNPKPRLFRLRQDKAVINRMGFNNEGLDAFAKALQRKTNKGIVGANLGANKDSADFVADYIAGLKKLWGLADYFTLNISSPNTPGLRNLQSRGGLSDLLGRVSEIRAQLAGNDPSPPIFLKVAPDLDFAQIERITQEARTYGMSGLIVANTTLERPASLQSQFSSEQGGLSGAPLFKLSTRILAEFYSASDGQIPLIGVGGIASGADAYAKIRAGASAVQLYSAMVYQGPSLAAHICTDLCARLKADGFSHISEAVGTRA